MEDNSREMKWKTLKSEYLIRRPWLTARRDTVELPNGIVNDEFWVLEYPDWVNTIAITKEGQYLFVRQYRYGLGETLCETCAGVCEKGEDPLTAARRELLEETGYAGGEWKRIMTISPNAGANTNLTYCYLATGVEKIAAQHLDRTEDLEICLLDETEVYQMLCEDRIKQALMAAPLWKYFAEKFRQSR